MIFCRGKVTIRTQRPPKVIQIQIRFRHNHADPTGSATLCEMEKNTVLWNRNDLLFRFRLWKSLVPVPAPVLRFRSHNTGKNIYGTQCAGEREREEVEKADTSQKRWWKICNIYICSKSNQVHVLIWVEIFLVISERHHILSTHVTACQFVNFH